VLITLELFVMLVLANGMPVVVAKLCRGAWDWPIDGNRHWPDGRPVLGPSKTWRGLVSGALSSALFSAWVGLGFLFGLAFGLLGLLGDMASSFVKRRLGLASSARALWLDQLPEAALPMAVAVLWLPVAVWDATLVVLLFALSNIFFSPILHRLGIRKHPH
jgi:CDP-2,3-bis-(O-geranylgeranyl)-sn-glycerol synthase|tara:strand:+ start:2383 stop:2865 length:483 start_codon:yes stop_codon:yes gene_type:complete